MRLCNTHFEEKRWGGAICALAGKRRKGVKKKGKEGRASRKREKFRLDEWLRRASNEDYRYSYELNPTSSVFFGSV